VSGTYIQKVDTICKSEGIKSAWGDDEELRTITCFNNDPICDHCFDLCQSILRKEDFLPRYSHLGCVGEPTTDYLQSLYKNISEFEKKHMEKCEDYAIKN
jgi:hypothetical protein